MSELDYLPESSVEALDSPYMATSLPINPEKLSKDEINKRARLMAQILTALRSVASALFANVSFALLVITPYIPGLNPPIAWAMIPALIIGIGSFALFFNPTESYLKAKLNEYYNHKTENSELYQLLKQHNLNDFAAQYKLRNFFVYLLSVLIPSIETLMMYFGALNVAQKLFELSGYLPATTGLNAALVVPHLIAGVLSLATFVIGMVVIRPAVQKRLLMDLEQKVKDFAELPGAQLETAKGIKNILELNPQLTDKFNEVKTAMCRASERPVGEANTLLQGVGTDGTADTRADGNAHKLKTF